MLHVTGASADAPTVLVADDDPDTLGLLLDTLRPQGFRLLSASDGDMALTKPFSAAHIRSRVRSWLLRKGA